MQNVRGLSIHAMDSLAQDKALQPSRVWALNMLPQCARLHNEGWFLLHHPGSSGVHIQAIAGPLKHDRHPTKRLPFVGAGSITDQGTRLEIGISEIC